MNIKIKSWQKDYERKKSGGNYYATQAIYLGENYLKLVFNKYYQGKYDLEQVADYLNFKQIEKVEKFEQYLLERNTF